MVRNKNTGKSVIDKLVLVNRVATYGTLVAIPLVVADVFKETNTAMTGMSIFVHVVISIYHETMRMALVLAHATRVSVAKIVLLQLAKLTIGGANQHVRINGDARRPYRILLLPMPIMRVKRCTANNAIAVILSPYMFLCNGTEIRTHWIRAFTIVPYCVIFRS